MINFLKISTITIFIFFSCENNPAIYTDCNGETNGLSIEDNCGICDNNPTNDCIENCSSTEIECCENNNGKWERDDLNISDEKECCENYSGTWIVEESICQGSTSIFEDNKCLGSYQCEGSISFWVDEKCWGGNSTYDECGICGGNGKLNCEGECINQDENGNYIDDNIDCFGVCNGTAILDECNVCNGPGAVYLCGCSGLEEEKCDCSGNILDCNDVCGGTSVEDCNGVCGGDAVKDECGVCDGDGIEENFNCNGECIAEGSNLDSLGYDECGVCGGDNSTCSSDFNGCTLPINNIYSLNGSVYYNVDFNILGFEWLVEGTTLSSVSGGDAASAGFFVQTGNNTVIGFSFAGSIIPAGCGILTNLGLSSEPTHFSNIEFIDDINSSFIPEPTVEYFLD